MLSVVYQGQKKEGNAARYVTRSQAVKQLQVSLPVFRYLFLNFCMVIGTRNGACF